MSDWTDEAQELVEAARSGPDPRARAAFIGLTWDVERGVLFRSVLEGIAFEARASTEGLLKLAGLTAPTSISVIGGSAMAGGLGMALGPLAGGLIYDTFATYSWLYIGSAGLGLGAFLIAMTFRPFPKSEMMPAAA